MIFTGSSWAVGNEGAEKILAKLELECCSNINFLRPSLLCTICNGTYSKLSGWLLSSMNYPITNEI